MGIQKGIQRLQLAGSSSTVFAVNLILYTKRGIFSTKNSIKTGKWLDLAAEPPRIKSCLAPHPPGFPFVKGNLSAVAFLLNR